MVIPVVSHGGHGASRERSELTFGDPVDRHSREYRRRSGEPDVEAQVTASVASQHVQIQENPEAKCHSPDRNGNADAPRINRTDTNVSKSTMRSMRRRRRSETASNIIYAAPGMGRTTGWSPGQEPGIDTTGPAPAYSTTGADSVHYEMLSQKCEITVVDFSPDAMSTVDLDNDNLEEFLDNTPQEPEDVRWINVNGLSWDVIKLLG